MAVNKAKKSEILEKLKVSFRDAKAIVFADYKGLPVKDFEALRNSLRKSNIQCVVAKKTLMKIAATEAGYPDLDLKKYEGSIVAIFSNDDEIEPARLAYKFSKGKEVFKIRGGIAEKGVKESAYIITLAQLPTKEELYAKLVGSMQSPIRGFHGVAHGLIRGLVQVLKALSEKTA